MANHQYKDTEKLELKNQKKKKYHARTNQKCTSIIYIYLNMNLKNV